MNINNIQRKEKSFYEELLLKILRKGKRMSIGKDVYNVIELEENLTVEEIRELVNYQWAKIILKYLEKVSFHAKIVTFLWYDYYVSIFIQRKVCHQRMVMY